MGSKISIYIVFNSWALVTKVDELWFSVIVKKSGSYLDILIRHCSARYKNILFGLNFVSLATFFDPTRN